jgi:Protein of unknown function (DUF1353)
MPWRHASGTGTSASAQPGSGFVPVELAQTGPRTFTLRADLVYEEPPDRRSPAGGRARRTTVVPAGFETDLVSVPFPLWALIGPFGRQTRAAILHDHDVRALPPPLRTPERLAEREAVDRRFRAALLDSDVPRLRAYLLWAGTSLDRITKHAHPAAAVLLVVQLAVGLALLVAGARLGGWPGLGLALVPLAAALLWGRARLAVALAQYVGAFVLPVIVLNLIVAAVLAAANLLLGGRARGIAPTRLPDDGRPLGDRRSPDDRA